MRTNHSRLVVSLVLFASAPLHSQLWEVGNQRLVDPTSTQLDARFGDSLAVGDFDGDGHDDLAVAAPLFDLPDGTSAAGRVTVLRGGADGLASSAWVSITGTAQFASAGRALAAGDFDGDGRDELALGVPGYDGLVDGALLDQSGAVVVYQFENGAWSTQGLLSQAGSAPGVAEAGDRFGHAFAVGDFDGDGHDDLAVGVPDESIAGASSAGAVNVFFGGAAGLDPNDGQVWYRSGGGIDGAAATLERLGAALAAGDFDADGADELAIGTPGRDLGEAISAGGVIVLAGEIGTGPIAAGQLSFDPTHLLETPANQRCGEALAAGDLNRASSCGALCPDDLVIGCPSTDVDAFGDTAFTAGRVHVLYGTSPDGLSLAIVDAFDQMSIDPLGSSPPEAADQFAIALAVGQLDGGLPADLVVGVALEGFEALSDAGAAHLLPGSFFGVRATGHRFLWQRPELASSPVEADERFGAALAIGDFDGDGHGDLAVGSPGEAVAGLAGAGAVQILYGALFADGFESKSIAAWAEP